MPDPDLSGTVLDGRYQVIAPIAEGAMGAVYRGERLKLGRAVAIKVLHESLPDELASRERFEREAKLMALLEHPHCVSVIDFGLHDDKPFLVMELVRGTSVMELIDKLGPLEVPRAADILRQVLSGLAHAHELGIVHRDIKPANIMVTEQTGLGEQVRILDFGLARLTEQSTKLTTGIVVGTPNYMAPEQIKGSDLDGRADLYACGVMLFEMVTGRKPFVADDPIAVVRKHLHEPPPRLAALAPGKDFGELEAVVARALAKDPAERYPTAAEMAAAIEAAVARRPASPVVDVHARAVPQTAGAPVAELATASGWDVPPGVASAALASSAAITAPSIAPTADPGSLAIPQAEPPSPAASAPVLAPPSTDLSGSRAASPPAPAPGPASSTIPTSPAAARPAGIPSLPFTRRQMMIAGGSLLGLVVLIAIIAGGRGGSHAANAPADAGTTANVASGAGPDPLAPLVARGNELYNAGEVEQGIDFLRKARRQYPDSAELAFIAGKLYFAKLWWTDGIKNFRDAIRIDPAYAGDPELIKIAIRGFNTTPDIDDRLESFLRDDIGRAAVPYLEDTARTNSSKTVRARAAAELRRFPR